MSLGAALFTAAIALACAVRVARVWVLPAARQRRLVRETENYLRERTTT